MHALIAGHFRESKIEKQPRLVNGHMLMKALHLEPSPLIGVMLAKLDELQAIGKITNKAQALAAARKLKRMKGSVKLKAQSEKRSQVQ